LQKVCKNERVSLLVGVVRNLIIGILCLSPWLAVVGAEKLSVLTTFAPIQCFTVNVAGDTATVNMLLPPQTGPHDYAFAPSDIRKMAMADVVVFNGLGIESWLERGVRSAAKSSVLMIDTSKGIPVIREQDETGVNPHIWLSPKNAICQVLNICEGLVKRDPEHAMVYRSNTIRYIERLKQLDHDLRATTDLLPNKVLITFHDSFAYLAQEFGLKVAATFEAFPGKEPTPLEIKKLREAIQQNGVKALFYEPQYSSHSIESVAQEFRLRVGELDPMETGDGAPDFYENEMRKNIEALATNR
jgi:zinc transport system substrate-binding protein